MVLCNGDVVVKVKDAQEVSKLCDVWERVSSASERNETPQRTTQPQAIRMKEVDLEFESALKVFIRSSKGVFRGVGAIASTARKLVKVRWWRKRRNHAATEAGCANTANLSSTLQTQHQCLRAIEDNEEIISIPADLSVWSKSLYDHVCVIASTAKGVVGLRWCCHRTDYTATPHIYCHIKGLQEENDL